MEQTSFTLGEVTYSVTKLGLRVWLELEEINKKIIEAMKGKSMLEASSLICSYLSVITKLEEDKIKTFFWLDVADAYATILLACIPKTEFPLLMGKSDKPETFIWDYEGRTWYKWSHLLAKSYGWSQEYIADLYFEDAIAFIQEVLIDEQMDKEWQWSLSELAYPYNKATKKSEFKALPRPSWMLGMRKPAEEIKPVKLPVSMIPMGIVLEWKANEKTVN